jgi:anti-sigma regulatory factor (Ser/Thr protein kinase)
MTAGLPGAGDIVLGEFAVASEPGNERAVLALVEGALNGRLNAEQLDRLKTAVAEATMNAIEHGNRNRPELEVVIRVLSSATGVTVTITDLGGEHAPSGPVVAPDLDEKLAGLQSPRGWGLFLISHMVDAMDVSVDGVEHTVRLVMHVDAPAAAQREGARGDG